MVGPLEIVRRLRGLATDRLSTLPILALNVHSACNCRCVMCDIWKANADRRELSPGELADHVAAISRLHVQRVMLTGGEPLLHSNLWALCDQLRQARIRVTLVTTGMLVEQHAAAIARAVDTVVISLDGPRETHDRIRRVKGGFEKIVRGVVALRAQTPVPRLIARSVVQHENFARLDQTIAAARRVGFDEVSFLAADVSSTAFNRPDGWPAERQAEVAVSAGALDAFAHAIETARAVEATSFADGFVVGGAASLYRLHRYYRAVAGLDVFPAVRCNAPWVSAVLEPGGTLRPCFFHEPYGQIDGGLDAALNSTRAMAFRRNLTVGSDTTCQRCVCSLKLPVAGEV